MKTVPAKKSKTTKPSKIKPSKIKKKKSKPLKPIFLKVKFNGFVRKSKKTGEKDADATEEGGGFDLMAEIVTPDDSPGEVNRTKSRTEEHLEDLKIRLDKVNQSIERMQAQAKESDNSKSGDEEERVGIEARYPISGEELLQCVQTDDYLEF